MDLSASQVKATGLLASEKYGEAISFLVNIPETMVLLIRSSMTKAIQHSRVQISSSPFIVAKMTEDMVHGDMVCWLDTNSLLLGK
jgi:hypothetical protein